MRRFTWYLRGCKSRIDRAFVNAKWSDTWRATSLRGLPRSVSDHCALLLSTKSEDWGPKPFRFLNAWMRHPGFLDIVANSWGESENAGWGSFVFKEKLKRLKGALKKWNKEHFGHCDKQIEDLRHELHELDFRDDNGGLTLDEVVKRSETSTRLMQKLNIHNSILTQKARMK